jgi:hypothetical protein
MCSTSCCRRPHDTEASCKTRLETDHGRLKSRLRPMRGLKRDRTARVVIAGHAFVQNLRRGFYDLGTDERPGSYLASPFSELASVIDTCPSGSLPHARPSANAISPQRLYLD